MHIILQLPEVKRTNSMRPQQCPHCKGETFQSWGKVSRRIKDTKVRTVQVRRFKCTTCQKTFRHYPAGVSRAQQSERLKLLAAIGWSFGLSYRKLAMFLSAFDIPLSRMSGWRDVQAAGEKLRRSARWSSVRVVGVDGAWLNGRGIMVAVDLGDGKLLAVANIDEKDMAGVQRWLKALKEQHGIGAIVTDDLAMYRGVAERLELGHQVCQFHVRRWVGRSYCELRQKLPEEWLWMLERIKQIMEEMPPDGGRELLELYRQLPGNSKHGQERTALDELRAVLIRLSESWERYTAFFHDPGIPWTNNQTESMIGKIKMRAKSVRGYKSRSGMLNGLLVSSQSWA